MFEMVMARTSAIACGYEDTNDHDRLRLDPLMKAAVGRHPQAGAPLTSQSTTSRLENAPSRTEAARLAVALLDQFGATVKPGRMEIPGRRQRTAVPAAPDARRCDVRPPTFEYRQATASRSCATTWPAFARFALPSSGG
jgi:hypothetical protein